MTTSSLAGRSEVFCEAAPPPRPPGLGGEVGGGGRGGGQQAVGHRQAPRDGDIQGSVINCILVPDVNVERNY